MAEIYFDVDAALSEVPVNIFPLTDDTNFKDREVSIAYNAAGMDLVWNFVTTAGAYTQTAVTPTTGGAYDWAHQGDGMYSIEIPASGGATINNDTEGFGWFTGFCTGVLPWRSPIFGFRAAGINNKLIDDAYDTARGLAGTALPAAAADTAGGLAISDAGGLDLDAKLAHTEEITAARMATLTDWIDGGRLDLLLDALLTRLTAARAGYLDKLNITGDVAGGTPLATMQGNVTDILADTNELQTDWRNTGRLDTLLDDAVGYASAVEGRLTITRAGYLDAAISSRSTLTAQNVWEYATRSLTTFGTLVADIATAVWGATTRTLSAFGFTVAATVADKTGYSIAGTKQTLDALNDFNPSSNTVARVTLVDTCTTNTDMRGTDSALLASGYTAPPSTSSIADAVWDEAISGHSGAGTAGLALTSASAPTAEQVADAVWDESVSGHTTGGSTGAAIIAAGSAGDPWSTLIPGAYGAGTAGKIVGDNVNATISSRSSHSATDVWAVSVRTLSSFGSLVTDIATAVWAATTRTLSAFGFTVAPTVADIRTEMDSNSTQLIAIKAKTDQLIFTVPGHVDATASITGGGDATEAHQLDMIDKLKGLMSKSHVLTTAVGAFAPGTDSNEAIRDRGDVAWNNGSINTMASTRSNTSTASSDAIIQDCAYKDISFKSGDDFEFDLDFPMDITAYTITAVVDGVSFTVTKKTMVRVGFSLTATQTATLRDNFPWSLTLVNAGKTRKYITGKYIKI